MKFSVLMIVLISLVFIVSACTTNQAESNTDDHTNEVMEETDEMMEKSDEVMEEDKPTEDSNTITITDSGYNPSSLTINVGDTVTFMNEGIRKTWPATDIHPTHRSYPGSSINKCGSSEQSNIFDACKGLSSGESYSFTFNEAGSWKYHDHLRSSLKGTIIVQ